MLLSSKAAASSLPLAKIRRLTSFTAWVQGGSRKNEELFHLSQADAVKARNDRIQAEVDRNPEAVQPDQSRLFGYDPVHDPLAE